MIKVPEINLTHKRNKICLVRAFDFRVGIQGLGERKHSFPPDLSLPTATPLQPNTGAGSGEFQTAT